MLIYKIFRSNEWGSLRLNGETHGAHVDVADGFVHFSTAAQVGETAAKHFAGVLGLELAAFDADKMGDDLKWEVSRGGELFPHLYNRTLRFDEVLWSRPLPLVDGLHIFPESMA